MRLDDGSGGGYKAKVDENYRLHTEGVVRDTLREGVYQGKAFNFNTGAMTLTSANESAVGYFKYDGDDPFIIEEILFILGATTGGSGDGTAKIIKNPTGGTIVTNAVPIEVAQNRDFSSQLAVEGDTFKGAEGYTTTGGSTFADTTRSSFGTVIAFDAASIILRKGNSLACTWTPPSGNTSQSVKIAATGYISGSDVFAD